MLQSTAAGRRRRTTRTWASTNCRSGWPNGKAKWRQGPNKRSKSAKDRSKSNRNDSSVSERGTKWVLLWLPRETLGRASRVRQPSAEVEGELRPADELPQLGARVLRRNVQAIAHEDLKRGRRSLPLRTPGVVQVPAEARALLDLFRADEAQPLDPRIEVRSAFHKGVCAGVAVIEDTGEPGHWTRRRVPVRRPMSSSTSSIVWVMEGTASPARRSATTRWRHRAACRPRRTHCRAWPRTRQGSRESAPARSRPRGVLIPSAQRFSPETANRSGDGDSTLPRRRAARRPGHAPTATERRPATTMLAATATPPVRDWTPMSA